MDCVIEDFEIVELLFNRNESGLGEISQKYKALYRNIIKQFLEREEDIAECENDVLMALWSSIPPNCPNKLPSYICRIARNIGINKYKYNTRAKRTAGYELVIEELSECIPDVSISSDHTVALEEKELIEVLTRLIETLDTKTRTLFVRRYYYLETVESLAKRYGISQNKVSVTLCRARKKLKALLEKEVYINE
ncbi:MAG: RNA polymerase sigma factor [Acutalibacteraceae bacterium]